MNYYDRKITYGKLFEEIEKTAKAFWKIGVRKDDIVPIVAVTLPEIVYAFYALNHIGAIANMIDPRTSIEGMHDYFDETNSKYIIALDIIGERVCEAIKDTKVDKVVLVSPADSLASIKKFIYRLSNKRDFSMKNARIGMIF